MNFLGGIIPQSFLFLEVNDMTTSAGTTTYTAGTTFSYVGEEMEIPSFDSYLSGYGIETEVRRTQSMDKVAIFGCGGVGSNLAYLLSKDPQVQRMYLIDHDIIEIGNLSRQFFIKDDVGKNKAKALATTLKQFAPDKEFVAIPLKVESNADLGQFGGTNTDMFVFVCTDNVPSKALISNYFRNVICLGCDVDLVEMRRKFDRRSVWSAGEGYNSNQTFESNMLAAAIGYMLFTRGHWTVSHRKVQISRLIEELLENGFEGRRRRS